MTIREMAGAETNPQGLGDIADLVDMFARTATRENLTRLEVVAAGVTVKLERGPTPPPPRPVRTPVAGIFKSHEEGAPPLVQVGARVTPASVVALVQDAGGVVNEILSEVEGTVSRQVVADGATVAAGE